VEKGEVTAKGITGTGVLPLIIEAGMRNNLIAAKKSRPLKALSTCRNGIMFTEKDLIAAEER
jgi:uncharacterized 2Fe-2S/4Fe-4S cluster protein (DUF4445 family)